MKKNTVSIVLPAFNEVKNLQKGVIDKVINYARNKKNIIEILIIDDGSTDGTGEIIKKNYIGQFPKIRLYEKKHSGKAYSIIAGMRQARGNIVLFSDIDLATPIEEADKIIQGIEDNYDIVIGSRGMIRKGAPLTRKIMAMGFIIIRNSLIGLKNIKDTQCGFKAFKKPVALDLIKSLQIFKKEEGIKGSSVSAGFDLELLFLAQKKGYRIKEIPVSWEHIETKNVNFFKDSLETLYDIFRIKLNELRGKYKK